MVGNRGLRVAPAEDVDLSVQHDGRVAASGCRQRRGPAPAARACVVDANPRDRRVRRPGKTADHVDLPAERNRRRRIQLAAWERRLPPPALAIEAIDDRRARAAENVDRVVLHHDSMRRARVRKRRSLRPGADPGDQEEDDEDAHLSDGGHSSPPSPKVDENLCKLRNRSPVRRIECVLQCPSLRSSWSPGLRRAGACRSRSSPAHRR